MSDFILDELRHWVPLLNLLLIVGFSLFVVLKQKGWTAPQLAAGIDHLYRITTKQSGEIAQLRRESESRRQDFVVAQRGIDAIHDRITNLDETWDRKFSELQKVMESLACNERAWHVREKPGYCPLHNQDCPLNGKDEVA